MNEQLNNELAALARTTRGVIVGTVLLRMTFLVLYFAFMAWLMWSIQ